MARLSTLRLALFSSDSRYAIQAPSGESFTSRSRERRLKSSSFSCGAAGSARLAATIGLREVGAACAADKTETSATADTNRCKNMDAPVWMKGFTRRRGAAASIGLRSGRGGRGCSSISDGIAGRPTSRLAAIQIALRRALMATGRSHSHAAPAASSAQSSAAASTAAGRGRCKGFE